MVVPVWISGVRYGTEVAVASDGEVEVLPFHNLGGFGFVCPPRWWVCV